MALGPGDVWSIEPGATSSGSGAVVSPVVDQVFTATEGQTIFTITESATVSEFEDVLVGGVPVYGWTSSTGLKRIVLAEGVNSGMIVVLQYRE